MIKRMISVLLTVMMVVSVVAIGVVNTGGAETDAVVTGWSIPSEIEFFQKLVTLRTRYPNGSTWDGTYYEGEKPKAFTAWGYACQIMYEVFGAMFYADNLLNYKDYSTSNLCAGDWVRIDSDSHSIFITKVTSGGVYYTDCNGTGVYNQIRWDGHCSWSEFRNRFSYRVHLPGNSLKGDYHEHIPCEPVQENIIPANCEEDGSYDEVVYCSACGEELSRETKIINKLAHTPGESVIENIIPATCMFEGTYDEVVYCTECGEEISREQKKINKLDHTPGDPVRENAVPATCETEGSYDEIVYCTECGEEISRELKTIDKLDHDIRYAEEVPATRTVDGMKAHFECTRCHKYFADSMGHIEISSETLIIKAEHLRGDANTDGVFDIIDVTTIQRVLAEYEVENYDEIAADADLDGIVDIIDAVLLFRIDAVMTTFERWDNSHMLANTGIAHDRLYETNSSDKTISSVGDSQTAIISIYGFNGQSETKSINVGDTFDVYTYLNASDLVDKGKIAGIDAYQMYTDSTLSLNSTVYPIFNYNIVYNDDNIGKILYNASTPEIDYPFVFNSDNDVIIKTTYTVTAPGQGEVRNAIKTLAAADEDITPIIKNGEIANNSVINVEVSFDKREHIHVPSSVVKENVIPATCKFEGTYDEVVYCTECGEEISRVAKTIDKLDHTPGEPIKENDTSSCLESGTYDEVVYCSKCGQEISRETKIAEPLGHHLVFVKQVYPTYSRNGRYAHYECDRCGKLYADATGTHEISEDILMIPMLVEETWAPEPTEAPTQAPYPATEPPAPEESTYGDFAYKLYSDGHIEITKYNGNDTTVSVPSEIDGHPVTLIDEKAFYGNTALTEVTIPNSVKFIGSNAFSHCSTLETVNLPASIKSLSSGLFSYCTSLKNVTIPASVTNIGYNAFYHCFSLTDITIPESVTSINSQAFDWCPSLKQVNIPKSVKSIGAKAFGYVCDQKIDGFKILGYENSAAHKYAKANGFDFESTGYIFVPPTEPKPTSPYPEPTEPPTEPVPTEPPMGQIGNYLYDLNTYDNTATLQKYSGKEANVSIPSQQSVKYPSYYYDSIYNGNYKVTAIGNTAFAGNSYVKSVTIPNTVTTIGDDAFFRCSSLSNVTIPNSVTSIGSWAFAQCDNLKNVTIPSSVTSIGDKAFGYIDANTKVDGFTITGRTGSAAYKYAVKNGFEFVANDSNISGDVDSDYEVTIMDATAIQAYLAYQRSLNGGEYEPVEKGSRDFTIADVDGDGRISIFDSLRIQRYCAKMCKLDGSPYDA